jgi:DNA-binding MarR family transcriptional regulator
LGGIALETKLRRQTVSAVLNQLIADGAVQKVAGEVSGTDYYELSPPPAQ